MDSAVDHHEKCPGGGSGTSGVAVYVYFITFVFYYIITKSFLHVHCFLDSIMQCHQVMSA